MASRFLEFWRLFEVL